MSSSPTVPTSTTSSSTSSASGPEQVADRGTRIALIACGAIAQPSAAVVAGRGWPVDVHPLPPLLHNHPEQIAGEVRAPAQELSTSYSRVVIGYADCGTYGALDEVCRELGLARLPGLHCYDVYAGASRLERFFDEQPGTYLLTDFLARSFARTVLRELGLDRYPELRDTYFGAYTRMVWLAQEPDDELRGLAEQAAASIGLPLTVVETGDPGPQSARSPTRWVRASPGSRPASRSAGPRSPRLG
ncbi:DUF1638 domain-containing protein [Nocardioides sp. B-3]|uniref:DUF1638 domain-containing protein n=1 Tax=Nocardioides sp. B-3 TaxID=2895565 RepID=UPI002152C5BB|nr:DUF1638 domain-containing protein [Nocardioides sp. B-3]UUZ60681.1 DUF1638 domain-containing protein [Nocardioides sp. B-3]